MNMASRMESNGSPSAIHISDETANLLIKAGKAAWIKLREDKIVAKGKGELTTWWVNVFSGGGSKSSDMDCSGSQLSGGSNYHANPEDVKENVETKLLLNSKTKRLIEWNVEVLLRLLRQIEAGRRTSECQNSLSSRPDESILKPAAGKTVLDEVQEVIEIPKQTAQRLVADPDEINLDPAVTAQLHDYVENVALMYQDNSFHNFEHGMSAIL